MRPARALRAGFALACALGLGACSGEPLSVRADGCWGKAAGSATADCASALGAARAALGFGGDPGGAVALLHSPGAAAACGNPVDCGAALSAASSRVLAPGGPTGTPSVPASGPGSGTAALAPPGSGPAAGADPAAQGAGTRPPGSAAATGSSAGSGAVAAAGGSASEGAGACKGIAIAGIEKKGQLTPAEQLCLQATAKGGTGAADSDVQTAAVALYNAKATGWQAAVEAALSRGALANAPMLNFAGIKPAYDRGGYADVLVRARNVWKNLDKGYQLPGGDRSFLVEFACRSAGQLALQGKRPSDGLDWCERWRDRAGKAGQPTQEIEDLVRQVE